MFKQYRPLLAASLALSLLAVGGCTLQPGSFLALDKAATTAAQAKSSLKVTIERPAELSTQAVSNLAIELRLELPYAQDPAHRLQSVSVQDGQEAVFTNLPPESGYLTAIFTDVETNQAVGTQKQNIQLRPGYETHATFTFVLGGSAAVDVGVKIGTNRKDYRQWLQSDGYDNDFQQSYPYYWDKEYWLQTETGTVSVRFDQVMDEASDRWFLARRIGNEAPVSLGVPSDRWQDWWYGIPGHAVRVESLESYSTSFGTYQKVRHYRWTNLFTVDGSERSLTIDRWYSPAEGLVKETIHDGSGYVSDMALSGV